MTKSREPLLRIEASPDGRKITVESVTLRDLFAAFALAGLISQSDRAMPTQTFASEAYNCADAMLAVREEG